MQIIANLGRIVASDSILPSLDECTLDVRCSLLILRTSADLHWRRREWGLAIELATRVLAKKQNDFHALAILANSYGQLGQMELAYPFAKRLLQAKRPNWVAVKVLSGFLGIFKLTLPKIRQSFYNSQLRCDEQAQTDLNNILWAEEVIRIFEAANDAAE